MEYFFRTIEDGQIMKMFSPTHMLMLSILFAGISLLVIFKHKVKQNKKISKIVKWSLGLIMASVIVLMYGWYAFSGYVGLKESLPLYHCRILMILSVIYLFVDNKILRLIIINWGIMGVTAAMLIPVTDPFKFPHVTFYTFFAGHIALGWYVTYLIIAEEYKFVKEDFILIAKITLIYNILLTLINISINANYGYLLTPPVMKDTLKFIPNQIYIIIMMLVYLLVNYTIYVTGKNTQKAILKRKQNKKESRG